MAKVGVRGAQELSRRTTDHGIYILRSDGTILWRPSVPGSRYILTAQITGNPKDFQRIFSGRFTTQEIPQ